MKTFVRQLVVVAMLAFASMAAVTIATPAVSKADCADGEWWDPTGKVCRPLGVGPQPLACDPGQWWDPDGQRVPAAGGRAATARLRQRLVVGPRAPTNAVRP